ncbi:hypothetical protein [Micromonospora chokoriensis]
MPSDIWVSMVSLGGVALLVREGLSDGEKVRDYLEANRLAFLDAARVTVG